MHNAEGDEEWANTDEELLAAYLEYLPHFVVGVEHEYKWLLEGSESFGGDPEAAVESLGIPPDLRLTGTGFSRQSSIYVDDHQWTLSRQGLSLAIIVRQGWKRSVCWLVLKDTVSWSRGRRDTFETAVRIEPTAVDAALADWSLLPMRRLERLIGNRHALRPFATNKQRRRKAELRSDFGSVLSVSFDEATLTAATPEREELERSSWIEVECNQSDGRAIKMLDGWAAQICRRLGTDAHPHSKPERAAVLMGCPAKERLEEASHE